VLDEGETELPLSEVFLRADFRPLPGVRVYNPEGGIFDLDQEDPMIADGASVTVSGIKEAGMAVKVLFGGGVKRYNLEDGDAISISELLEELDIQLGSGHIVYVGSVKVTDLDQEVDDGEILSISGVKEAGAGVVKVLYGGGLIRHALGDATEISIENLLSAEQINVPAGHIIYVGSVKVTDRTTTVGAGDVLAISGVKAAGSGSVKVLYGGGIKRHTLDDAAEISIGDLLSTLDIHVPEGHIIYVGSVKVTDRSTTVGSGDILSISGVKAAGR
jgi:ABC-type uncharacterized transport system ATPase subunit